MEILIVGCGISGLTASYYAAKKGNHVTLISPLMPERSQSIMAAGGVNGCLNNSDLENNYKLHALDTINSGQNIDNEKAVYGLCQTIPNILLELEKMGMLFNREDNGELRLRKLGGHSKKRTLSSGACTGKQIVTTLVRQVRYYYSLGLIEHRLNLHFIKGLIKDGVCYGGLFLNDSTNKLELIYADKVIVATGGANKIFGKTTGSVLNDGYVQEILFEQGATLRNLEFVQYHPTTIETLSKRMLITEAARSEGGRLFYYLDDSSKCYFMEEKYGPEGNLKSRDIVSQEIFNTHKQCYLDISFLDEEIIKTKLSEVYQICLDYLDLNVTKEPIPISPSVHFFMGGIAVDESHFTGIKNLYAIGECASLYHGANRLGGNSLAVALYSGYKVIESLDDNKTVKIDFDELLISEQKVIDNLLASKSQIPVNYFEKILSSIMMENLGIVRDEKGLLKALEDLEFYSNTLDKIHFNPTYSIYEVYAIKHLFTLAKALTLSALNRQESRGAHYRSDYPNKLAEYQKSSFITYNQGNIEIKLEAYQK